MGWTWYRDGVNAGVKCVIDIAVGDCVGLWGDVLKNGVLNKGLNKCHLAVFVFCLVSVCGGSRNTVIETMKPVGIFSSVEDTPGPTVLSNAM